MRKNIRWNTRGKWEWKKCILSIKDINYRKNSDEKIIESVRGFSPLKQHLPIWIEEKITELRKEEDTAD